MIYCRSCKRRTKKKLEDNCLDVEIPLIENISQQQSDALIDDILLMMEKSKKNV